MTHLNGIIGEERVNEWITGGINEQAITYAESFGIELVHPTVLKKDGSTYIDKNGGLTTTQIRNFFGEVQRIKMKGYEESQFVLLKPKLAYAVKRNETAGAKDFKLVFEAAINAVIHSENKNKSFNNFADFFEAVLAYHKAYGGKS